MMRIAFIDHKLNLRDGGGSNITLHHLACGLIEIGHDVSVVTVGFEHSPPPENVPYRVIERPLAARVLDLRAKFALVSVLRDLESQVDVIQIEAPSLISAGALYRLLGGRTPIVVRLHNYSFFCTNIRRMDSTCYRHCTLLNRLSHRRESTARKFLLSPLRIAEHYANRLLVNRIDRFIALTPAVAQIHSQYGIDSRKMVIIPPPRDPAMVIDAPAGNRLAARDPDQPFRILFTGRLSKVKGVDTLLQAVATLDFPLAVDIVGDGIVREELEQLAHDLGIRSLVRFHGWVSQADIADFYRRADVFVHPARWPEPAGRTIIEAMALGVPAIVSDIGGPPWIAGDAALTFAPGDCADLRDRILTVHQTPEVSSQMRVAARKRIDRYDRRRIAISLANLYDELVPVGTTADGSDSTDATPVVASADAELTSTLISRR